MNKEITFGRWKLKLLSKNNKTVIHISDDRFDCMLDEHSFFISNGEGIIKY